MAEEFIVIFTSLYPNEVSRHLRLLEGQGIAVFVEEVELKEERDFVTLYRLRIPRNSVRKALRVMKSPSGKPSEQGQIMTA